MQIICIRKEDGAENEARWVESRGSHDFHRVILDFKKESPGSVLLLRASRAEYSAAG